MNCIIYARFSPRPDQATSDSNIKQIDHCIEYAAEQGWTVKGIFEDKAKSRDDANREGMAGAIASLKRGDVLLCYDSSRFGAGAAAVIFEDEVRKKKATMAFVVGGPVEDTLDARLVREIMYAVNNYQRARIGARTQAKAIEAQRSGRVRSKHLPYGYKLDPDDPKKMVKDEQEWRTVKQIFKLRRDGLSIAKIARQLEQEGRPKRQQSRWHTTTIERILERESHRLKAEV